MDEQMIEEISRVIGESYSLQKEVEIELFGELENRIVRGTIKKVDPHTRRLKVVLADEGSASVGEWEQSEWVSLGDIIRISMSHE